MSQAQKANMGRAWALGPRPCLIGMVHLPALPGAVQHRLTMQQIVEQAVDEARLLQDSGFDAVLVENFGDCPFPAEHVRPHTVAAMAVVAEYVCRAVSCPVGVNVLRNDARGTIAVAAVAGAKFVRVNVHVGVYATDQGLIQGRADRTLRYRRELGAEVLILADVHVKHARPLWGADLGLAAAETAYRGLADGLIVTGPATGQAVAAEDLAAVRQAVPDRPVLVGSGVTPENVAGWLGQCEGAIVGSSLKYDGRVENRLDPHRVKLLVARARGG
jgi:membrane complex biogenesis BtpA family protein